MYCKVCKKDQETMKSNTVCLSCAEHRAAYYLKTSAKRIANAKQYKNSERGKELAILSRKKWIDNNREQHYNSIKNYQSSIKGRFNASTKKAINRKLTFTISLEEYTILVSQPCYYCNDFFGKVTMGVGLDRMNNSIGYELDNVVSCCKICNRLKSNTFSPKETKAAIEAIIAIRSC